jgi:hypothetical protein
MIGNVIIVIIIAIIAKVKEFGNIQKFYLFP